MAKKKAPRLFAPVLRFHSSSVSFEILPRCPVTSGSSRATGRVARPSTSTIVDGHRRWCLAFKESDPCGRLWWAPRFPWMV
jgi:hypothetical protein